MINALRLKLATWLAPSLKQYQRMFESQLQTTAEMDKTISALRGDVSQLTRANDDARDRMLVAALRISVLRSALKKALPYAIDAVDGIDEQLDTKLTKKKREALSVIREAVQADLDDIRKAYLGKSSADAIGQPNAKVPS